MHALLLWGLVGGSLESQSLIRQVNLELLVGNLSALRNRPHVGVGGDVPTTTVWGKFLEILEGALPLVERVDFPIRALVDLGGSQVEQLISPEVVADLAVLPSLSTSRLVSITLLLGRFGRIPILLTIGGE